MAVLNSTIAFLTNAGNLRQGVDKHALAVTLQREISLSVHLCSDCDDDRELETETGRQRQYRESGSGREGRGWGMQVSDTVKEFEFKFVCVPERERTSGGRQPGSSPICVEIDSFYLAPRLYVQVYYRPAVGIPLVVLGCAGFVATVIWRCVRVRHS
jgi:hypothetical protein